MTITEGELIKKIVHELTYEDVINILDIQDEISARLLRHLNKKDLDELEDVSDIYLGTHLV